MYEELQEQINQAWIDIADQKQRIEELQTQLADLKPYIKHRMMCARHRAPIRPHSHPDGLLRQSCDCGLDAILNREKAE